MVGCLDSVVGTPLSTRARRIVRTSGCLLAVAVVGILTAACSASMPSLGASDLTGKPSFPQQPDAFAAPIPSGASDGAEQRGGANPKVETDILPPTRRKGSSDIVYGDGSFINVSKSQKAAELTRDGDVVLNFSEVDIRQFAQAVIGDILNANFVVDSDIATKITLRTNRPIGKDAVIPAIETTLAAAGLALSRDGEIYRIMPLAKAKGSGVPLLVSPRGKLPPGYGVTAVILKHMSPSQMAKVLEPLAPENSVLRVDDMRNLLILAAIGPEMTTLLETVEMFDVDALKGMSVGYFKLVNAKASDVSDELQSVIKAQAAQAGIGPPQVVSIDRLNALFVLSSRPKTMELAKQWVERLDKSQDETKRQLFVYHLKNRKAEEVAAVLSKIFGEGSAAAEQSTSRKATEPLAPDTPTAELRTRDNRVRVASIEEPHVADASPPVQATQLAGDVRIVADQDNNSLLVRATQADYRAIEAAIGRLDLVPPLVLIEVTIAEIALRDGLKFGIEWFLKEKQSSFSFSSLENGRILSQFPGFSYFFAAQDIAAVLNAMSEVTDVRVVSSPRVMVRDSKTATLQIGDQVPVITSTSQSTLTSEAPVIQTVQYFDTGVILKVSPQVNGGGLVTMDVTQEVSNVAAQSTDGIQSPTIQQRKITSAIAVQSGEAVVLGGLMREARSKSGTAVPLVSKVPGIGELFKTHDNDQDRTELLVVITPRVVWGRSDARQVTDELRQKMEKVVRQQDAEQSSAVKGWHTK